MQADIRVVFWNRRMDITIKKNVEIGTVYSLVNGIIPLLIS